MAAIPPCWFSSMEEKDVDYIYTQVAPKVSVAVRRCAEEANQELDESNLKEAPKIAFRLLAISFLEMSYTNQTTFRLSEMYRLKCDTLIQIEPRQQYLVSHDTILDIDKFRILLANRTFDLDNSKLDSLRVISLMLQSNYNQSGGYPGKELWRRFFIFHVGEMIKDFIHVMTPYNRIFNEYQKDEEEERVLASPVPSLMMKTIENQPDLTIDAFENQNQRDEVAPALFTGVVKVEEKSANQESEVALTPFQEVLKVEPEFTVHPSWNEPLYPSPLAEFVSFCNMMPPQVPCFQQATVNYWNYEMSHEVQVLEIDMPTYLQL